MLVTYNFVTKCEQGYLTTSKMWRMLISGVIYIKQTDATSSFFSKLIFWPASAQNFQKEAISVKQ